MMNLGKITYIKDLRKIWAHEEREFTPWLAENISLLGEELGLDLEIVSVEHSVGAFALDILAKETSSGHIVAIENQLETTDHNHLGQILTYASGVEAQVIVWICKEVREEHRKAIDWLNQVTNEETEFFFFFLQLIRIDDSEPAPFFKVKASPNDWSKEQKTKVTGTGERTKREEFFRGFFENLLERVNKELPGFTNSKKVGYDSWKLFPTGISGANYIISFKANNLFSCGIYLDTGNKENTKALFDSLFENKELIEGEIGKLSWERLEDKRACRIADNIEYSNQEDAIKWGIRRLAEFKKCFSKYFK